MEPVRIPATDELHRNRRRVAIVSVVVVLITVSVFLGLSLNSVGTVNVMGVQVHILYSAPSSSYFGKSIQNFTSNFRTMESGRSFHFAFDVTNYGSVPHTITSVSSGTGGFNLISMNDHLPITINGSSSQRLVITFQLPQHNYAGDLVIDISAS